MHCYCWGGRSPAPPPPPEGSWDWPWHALMWGPAKLFELHPLMMSPVCHHPLATTAESIRKKPLMHGSWTMKKIIYSFVFLLSFRVNTGLKAARIFPEHARKFLFDFGSEAARDKDTERLAAVCTLFGQFIYSNRVRLLENGSLMKKGPSNMVKIYPHTLPVCRCTSYTHIRRVTETKCAPTCTKARGQSGLMYSAGNE